MAKYDPQAALALRLITAKGKSVTFTRPGSVVDPVTQQSVDASTTYALNMFALPLSASKARLIFGDGPDMLKPRLSIYIAMSGATQTPRQGDRFDWAGKAYSLMEPELLDPAGESAPILAQGMAESA